MGEDGGVLAPVLPLRPLWHMGALHPYEQALTLLLAFGPFVVLGDLIPRNPQQTHRQILAGDFPIQACDLLVHAPN